MARKRKQEVVKEEAADNKNETCDESPLKKTKEEEEEDQQKEEDKDTGSDVFIVVSNPSIKESPIKKISLSQEEYDDYLIKKKEGRFVRIGQWNGMSKAVLHRCSDGECAREWRPSPSQCLADDYYCPSCVLHHRNNMYRFEEERLKWTANVPNTFYVFSLRDPRGDFVIKFGRTQHADALKRYSVKERKDYQMKLLLSIRNRLIVTTKIENWWKEEADKSNYYHRFSAKLFHGLTECLKINDKVLQDLLAKSKQMAEENMS